MVVGTLTVKNCLWRQQFGLALLALSAGPDLRQKDKNWNATALDWANHLGHNNIARLIGQYRK